MVKASRIPNHEKTFREQMACLRERTDYPRVKGTENISREESNLI